MLAEFHLMSDTNRNGFDLDGRRADLPYVKQLLSVQCDLIIDNGVESIVCDPGFTIILFIIMTLLIKFTFVFLNILFIE